MIVGIGVNLNAAKTDFPPDLRRKATSLALAAGARSNSAARWIALVTAVTSFALTLLAAVNFVPGPGLQTIVDVGLGYVHLGQSGTTLSGGEAQRLKLVTELSSGLASYRERSRGELPRNLYLLEEPTIGLHLSDCEKLIRVLHSLVEQGHTVVVIEHHLDLLAEADYIVELGPNGGPTGGQIMYQGPLAGLLKAKKSPTAPYLREKLKR